ncbi:MAG: CDP-alcohol phosphatidyltransferase family protein [Litorilinea sp.]
MRDAALRSQKDRLMTPFARRAFVRVHPNLISVVAMAVGLAAAWAVTQELYWLGLGLWWGNRILDGLDGLVARLHHKQSDFGGYLDLLLDFVVYLAVPVAFVLAQPTGVHLWALVALVGSYVLNTISWTVLAAILEKRQLQSSARATTIEMPVGIVEGAETIVLYTVFFLIPWAVGILFWLMAALVMATVVQRVIWAYRHLP